MAHIEVNAMSVKLSSTFEAEIFFPGMNLEGEKKISGNLVCASGWNRPGGTGKIYGSVGTVCGSS